MWSVISGKGPPPRPPPAPSLEATGICGNRYKDYKWVENNESHREFSESDAEPLESALFRKAINVKVIQKNTNTAITGP